MKGLYWLGTSLDDVRGFPAEARREAGTELYLVQQGLEPTDWKPMSVVGAGAREIRIRLKSGAYRVLYVVESDTAVYVLHAFRKTTQKTARSDIDKGQGPVRIDPVTLPHHHRTRPMATRTTNDSITPSSGNVFADLGFDEAETAVLTLRAELIAALKRELGERKLTQVQASRLLQVSQGRVSDLSRGKVEKFSLDMLVTFAARLGKQPRLELAA